MKAKVSPVVPERGPLEAKNVAVCWDKLGDWAGTPQEVDGDATQAELPSEAHTHCSR